MQDTFFGDKQAQSVKMAGIVNPRIIEIPNVASGTGSILTYVNDSLIYIPAKEIDVSTYTSLLSVNLAGVTCYVIGKMDNANPYMFKGPGYIGRGYAFSINPDTGNITGVLSLPLYIGFDGINTYIVTTQRRLADYRRIHWEPQIILRNLQLSVN